VVLTKVEPELVLDDPATKWGCLKGWPLFIWVVVNHLRLGTAGDGGLWPLGECSVVGDGTLSPLERERRDSCPLGVARSAVRRFLDAPLCRNGPDAYRHCSELGR